MLSGKKSPLDPDPLVFDHVRWAGLVAVRLGHGRNPRRRCTRDYVAVALPGSEILAWSIAAAVLCVWGCLQSEYVARTWPNKDPGQFVLDEVVGYLVTLITFALMTGDMPMAMGPCRSLLLVPRVRRLEATARQVAGGSARRLGNHVG